MQIFAAMADPHSFSRFSNVPITSVSYYGGDVIDYVGAGKPADTITVPINGNNVFSLILCASWWMNGSEYNTALTENFVHVIGNNGKKIFSFGSDNSTRYQVNIYAYNDAGTVVSKTSVQHPTVWNAASTNGSIGIYLHLDADPSKHTLRLTWQNAILCELFGSAVTATTATSLTNWVMCRPVANQSFYYGYQLNISSVVVSDVEDYSLAAYALKPLTLNADNQFTGTIPSLQTWLQDRVYMASSSEVAAKCSFKVGLPSNMSYAARIRARFNPSVHGVKRVEHYAMTRYVQDGGTSANFSLKVVKDDGIDLHPATVFNTLANRDDTTYLTKYIGGYDLNNANMLAVEQANYTLSLEGV